MSRPRVDVALPADEMRLYGFDELGKAWTYLGEDLSRGEVEARLGELLALERQATLFEEALWSGPAITRENLMTVAEVAELLGLSAYTVKEYARRGILPGRKLGRSWRFLRPELDDALRQLPRHAP